MAALPAPPAQRSEGLVHWRLQQGRGSDGGAAAQRGSRSPTDGSHGSHLCGGGACPLRRTPASPRNPAPPCATPSACGLHVQGAAGPWPASAVAACKGGGGPLPPPASPPCLVLFAGGSAPPDPLPRPQHPVLNPPRACLGHITSSRAPCYEGTHCQWPCRPPASPRDHSSFLAAGPARTLSAQPPRRPHQAVPKPGEAAHAHSARRRAPRPPWRPSESPTGRSGERGGSPERAPPCGAGSSAAPGVCGLDEGHGRGAGRPLQRPQRSKPGLQPAASSARRWQRAGGLPPASRPPPGLLLPFGAAAGGREARWPPHNPTPPPSPPRPALQAPLDTSIAT